MYVAKIDPRRPDKKIITAAAEIIKKGGLVAFPTETVYGIATNLQDLRAIDRLYKVKNRPKGKPFTVHISDIRMIETMGCDVTNEAKLLMDKFWPGPLTIILKTKSGKSVGFRMPANRVALDLISASGVPIAASSANLNGLKPPTSAEDVLRDLDEKLDMVLDAGKTSIGIESTIVDIT
ncbi:MAG: L-threonylcarbamoyladenylate synthase, partial [Candidatus Omnitrophica bacterium]|nr:L-threonylcarbamoyladenylate synthase [Candidatus Omnitrophota bacterium]